MSGVFFFKELSRNKTRFDTSEIIANVFLDKSHIDIALPDTETIVSFQKKIFSLIQIKESAVHPVIIHQDKSLLIERVRKYFGSCLLLIFFLGASEQKQQQKTKNRFLQILHFTRNLLKFEDY